LPHRVSSPSSLQTPNKSGSSADRSDDQTRRRTAKPDAPVRPKLQQKKQEIALTAVERYNRVVAAAELDAIRIVTAEFNAAPSAHQTLAGSEGETAIAHVIHHVHDFTLDSERGIGSCGVSFQLRVSRDVAEEDDLIRVRCEFIVIYKGFEEQHVDSVRRYVERVGLYAAYPYFRAHLGHLAFLADTIRIPVLPVLKETSPRLSRAQASRRA
jgi:hypothetical protein